MEKLRIQLGVRSYPILIGPGLLDDAALLGEAVAARDVLVVSNTTVAPLYLAPLERGLRGKRVASVILPDGEQYKTLETLGRVFDALVERRMNRDACVVALGGGVVGDMAGQRCIKHKLTNVLGYIPKAHQATVEPELKAIFYQPNREAADQTLAAFGEKYATIYPSAVECLKRDGEACLTFYAFPAAHWKTIRTTNVIERLFEEVKKGTHKMSAAFRTEGSCLLMFYAVIRSLKFRRIVVEPK